MINFTVGPVQTFNYIRRIGSKQVPYFRTQEFSKIMMENEELIKKFAKASTKSRAVFITGSGTASMEASVINLFNNNKDKVIIINGGSFGQRFVDICKLHNINYSEIKIDTGKNITLNQLDKFANKGYTGLLVNMHETSTGELYDIELISKFCKKNNLFLLVDAISSFLADQFDMQKLCVGAMITGSQKALACPPGISIIVLSEDAIERIYENDCNCLYFDLKNALKNGERGQTPFTPAVGILLQINRRLKVIDRNGGVEYSIKKTSELAKYFRSKIKNLPFSIVPDNPSNALTALYSNNNNADNIFKILKDKYKIWICPNGGELKDKIFRVGHIGDLNKNDYNKLIRALNDMNKKHIL